MRLTNNSKMKTDEIREIIRFVCPSGVTGFDVQVGHCTRKDFKGQAYEDWSLVKCYISKNVKYPLPPNKRKNRRGYLPLPYFASQTEVMVYLMAHELRHLWQRKVPRGWRVWGARGQYSERDACAYGIRMLREWRRSVKTPLDIR